MDGGWLLFLNPCCDQVHFDVAVPTVVDRTLQQAITQQLVPIYEPLLANIYLNEFDQEFLKRGVPCIRYADDIVLLAKSKRASERLLGSSTKYLEETLKLTVNREKSRTVSVFAIRNFKFLGFALGRNGSGIYVRVHAKSWKKFKS